MGQLRDSEIENQKREIERISSQKQQLEGNDREIKIKIFFYQFYHVFLLLKAECKI